MGGQSEIQAWVKSILGQNKSFRSILGLIYD